MGLIHGQTKEFMKGSGLIIKCMEKEDWNRKLIKNILENFNKIKNMVLVNLNGVMVVGIEDNGRMVNNTEKGV